MCLKIKKYNIYAILQKLEKEVKENSFTNPLKYKDYSLIELIRLIKRGK